MKQEELETIKAFLRERQAARYRTGRSWDIIKAYEEGGFDEAFRQAKICQCDSERWLEMSFKWDNPTVSPRIQDRLQDYFMTPEEDREFRLRLVHDCMDECRREMMAESA